jgi:hypothetical protein
MPPYALSSCARALGPEPPIREADIEFAGEVQSAAGYHTTNTGTLPSARTCDV